MYVRLHFTTYFIRINNLDEKEDGIMKLKVRQRVNAISFALQLQNQCSSIAKFAIIIITIEIPVGNERKLIYVNLYLFVFNSLKKSCRYQ